MSSPRWTAEQAAAITSPRHTLLAAGAGTGKTTTLIGKIFWHLGLASGMDDRTGKPIEPCPEPLRCSLPEIVAITFTEKAAHDLKRKLRDELRRANPALLWDLDRASIGTIHSFCGQLLREYAFRFGIDPSFNVLDERESRVEFMGLLREFVLARLSAGDPRAERLVGDSISLDGFEHSAGPVDFLADMVREVRWHGESHQQWLAGGGLDGAALRKACGAWDEKDDALLEKLEGARSLAAEFLSKWKEYLEEENARDFDALILDCRDILASEAGRPALESIRSRTRLLIIDEFQDTDGAQRDIAFMLAGLRAGHDPAPTGSSTGTAPTLFLVGDPKQSIYGFRGADIAVWNQVRESLTEFGRPLELSGNFRSDPAVIEYVNRVCDQALGSTARKVASEGLKSAVTYSALQPARKALGSGQVEWLNAVGDTADDRRDAEAEAIAARIRHLVIDPDRGDHDGVQVVDPDTGLLRDCKYRDVAILFRVRTGLDAYTRALAKYGVPFYLAGDAGILDRLEIADLLNLFRLIANPLDDLAAFTYLRGPFVALRDEVLTAIRLSAPSVPLLDAARKYQDNDDWFDPGEHPKLVEVERDALRTGLDLVRDLISLRSRVHLDQLATMALERSGYPLHLMLLPQPEPKLANLTRFIRILEGYRNQTVGTFLEMWDRWESQDLGIPQAPLYSKHDNVVTISTIHAAKGLEWPVVVLAGMDGALTDKLSGEIWTDPALGPAVGAKQADRGARATRLCERRLAESRAEEARLLYVATTRARDRLIIAGPRVEPKGRGEWLANGIDDAVLVQDRLPHVDRPPLPPAPELTWLDDILSGGEESALVRPLRRPRTRYARSASELMAFKRDRAEWRLKFEYGVMPTRHFVRSTGGGGVPAVARGTVIHRVLEEIEDEADLAQLLDVAVGSLDSPELEERLAPGSAERAEIAAEIERVIDSEEWRWYTDGEHYREIRFVQFRSPRRWYIGAMDLWRPGDPEGLIVDFKTQAVTADHVAAEAKKYRLQALAYRVIMERFGRPASFRFHFTGPNACIDSERARAE